MMGYYRSWSRDPAWNLAMEEFFFDCMDRGKSYLLLWQNHNTVVIGKNQNTQSEIDSGYVRDHGIRVVRRLSGGGAVYHDDGNLNFTFITDAEDGQRIDLHRFCVPIAETLRSFGVDAQISGRNDITVDGKKFSGNAQYVRQGRVMHHGTLMFDSDLSVLQKVLQVNREKLSSKGIASVSSRVTNLRPYLPEGVTIEDFAERLVQYLSCRYDLETLELTEQDLDEIEKRKNARYDTWQWNYGRSPESTWTNGKRVEGCGWVSVSHRVEDGLMRDVTISGDFFGNRDISCLTERLNGCRFSRLSVLELLGTQEVAQYIHNMTPTILAELLTP